jgi:subtilisin family serine protease
MSKICLIVALVLLAAPVRAQTAPNDPFFSSKGAWGQDYGDQWALARVGLMAKGTGQSAWDIETGESRPIIVAVLDTGLDYLHPDFRPRNLWRNPKPNVIGDDPNGYKEDFIGWNFVENNNHPWDTDGHGTFVAGLIGAAANNGHGIAGVNWGVRLMPLKVMNTFGKGRAFNLARAIIYAAENGARIINLSVEGEKLTRTEQLAIDHARGKGALIVMAAGNQASDTGDKLASLRHVLPVAALDGQDKRAGFSNWGKHIRLAAPGVDILSLRARRSDFMLLIEAKDYKAGQAFVGPQNQFMRSSGTSFAAPLVSGVASLILAKNPKLTPDQLERMLLMSADDVETPGWDQLTGYGRVNARKALEADPDYFLYAELHKVAAVKEGNRVVLQASGTTAGSHWGNYHLEVGQGDNPTSWRRAGNLAGGQVRDGLLGTLAFQDFGAPGRWTVRLVAQDTKGLTRESRVSMTLQ